MRRYFIAFVLGLVALAPTAASAQTTLAGSIDSFSSEGTLSRSGSSQTISFDVTFTCTTGDLAVLDVELDQPIGGRHFFYGIQIISEPTPCTGEPQTLTLTGTFGTQPPFVFVPGAAYVFLAKLTVCDPTLGVCELADQVPDFPATITIRLVPG
jgi:hypothetical protein